MHGDRPRLGKGDVVIIRQVEESHVILEISNTLYRARYLTRADNSLECRLQPDDCLRVFAVNLQAVDAMTFTERIDRHTGTGDGCRYLFHGYQTISQRE